MCKELKKIMATEPIFLSKTSNSTLTHEDGDKILPIMPLLSCMASSAGTASLFEHNAAEGAASCAAAMNHISGEALTVCSGSVVSSHPAAVTTEMLSPNASSTGSSELEIPSQLQSKHLNVLLMTKPHNQYFSISDESSPLMATNDAADYSSPQNLHGYIQHRRPFNILQGRRGYDHAFVALQPSDHAEQISFVSRADVQSYSKKLQARMWTPESFKEDNDIEAENNIHEAEEELQGTEEEEEGCRTPTARDQRIPQYIIEQETKVCAAGLVCPPAPKKKPCAFKRRRLHQSTDDHSFQITAERRPFLVDPPDLENFPECIRALFK